MNDLEIVYFDAGNTLLTADPGIGQSYARAGVRHGIPVTAEEIEAHFGFTIRSIVEEVSDDKSLGKQACKQMQIDKAPTLSTRARAVKLADKICNLRDVVVNPPSGWPLERRQGYFDWAKRVIDGLRGEHAVLESLFDEVYGQRPGG